MRLYQYSVHKSSDRTLQTVSYAAMVDSIIILLIFFCSLWSNTDGFIIYAKNKAK